MSTMLDRDTKKAFTFITSHVDAYNPLVTEQAAVLRHGPGSRIFDPGAGALAILQQRIGVQALLSAFNSCFLLLAMAFLAASWVILLMKRPTPGVALDAKAAH
jgi:hypothetical protein